MGNEIRLYSTALHHLDKESLPVLNSLQLAYYIYWPKTEVYGGFLGPLPYSIIVICLKGLQSLGNM